MVIPDVSIVGREKESVVFHTNCNYRCLKQNACLKGKNMKIKLVFNDWQKRGKSIYNTEEGIILSMGDFHSGSVFDGEIVVSADQKLELEKAMEAGYQPVFWVSYTLPKEKG